MTTEKIQKASKRGRKPKPKITETVQEVIVPTLEPQPVEESPKPKVPKVKVTKAEKKEKEVQYRQYLAAVEFVSTLGLKSQAEWKEYCASGLCPEDIPHDPNQVYTDWLNFDVWLGVPLVPKEAPELTLLFMNDTHSPNNVVYFSVVVASQLTNRQDIEKRHGMKLLRAYKYLGDETTTELVNILTLLRVTTSQEFTFNKGYLITHLSSLFFEADLTFQPIRIG